MTAVICAVTLPLCSNYAALMCDDIGPLTPNQSGPVRHEKKSQWEGLKNIDTFFKTSAILQADITLPCQVLHKQYKPS